MKLLDAMREVLIATRCHHEFTYWEPRDMAGCDKMESWKRTCTKCRMRETAFSETEPANYESSSSHSQKK